MNLINIEQTAIGGNLIKTVNARELHEFLEVGRDFTNWIKGRIEQYGFVEGQDFTPILAKSSGGRPSTEYHTTLDMAKELSMVERNDKGREARRYFIECERQLREATAVPNFSDPAEAAIAWAEQYRATQLALATKAEIGNRREATAMNTASQAVKTANKLKEQLDQSMQYASIKRMEMLCHGQKFNWRLLKSTGIEMDLLPIDIFDANYGTVKAYHADVWKETYALDINTGQM